MHSCPLCLLLLSLAITSLLPAQDGDAEAITPKQARAAFTKADAALNAVWAKAKKELSAEEFTALKEDQKSWLEMRDSLSLSPSYSGAPDDDDEAKQSAEYFSTAATLMEERTQWLQAFIAGEQGDSLTGSWSDSRGGHIDIVEKDGHLHFILETVRGHTADLGQIAGIATWASPSGLFTDKGRDKDKEEETTLSFVWEDRALKVEGSNTHHYHGKRAWFDGSYVKVGELDKMKAARVMKVARSGEIPEAEEQ